MAPGSKPFQLLEINIISAQDLEPVSRKMNTYARAWVNPDRKLSSCVDKEGNNNPTWNDKFVFRVDEDFLSRDSSAVMIEIYAAHWFRDTLVGTVRVLVGNLIPPTPRSRLHQSPHHIGMRFVALQIRRPSGRPQGILNIGVALLDGSLRSMPLYTLASSAVGYRDLMDDPQRLTKNEKNNKEKDNNRTTPQAPPMKPILIRSRSERSERFKFDDFTPRSSMVGVPTGRLVLGNSLVSMPDSVDPLKNKGKASSVISGAELREKPEQKGKKGKASSVVSDSVLSKGTSPRFYKKDHKPIIFLKKGNVESQPPKNKMVDEKPVTKFKPLAAVPKGKYVIGKGNSMIWTDDDVGPSPSEVAAVMAKRRYPLDDNQSSVLDGWSMDESVEGLRSKLERWRMELPPLYDHRCSSKSSSQKSSSIHGRSHGGSGLFSCFGNICGYECQCICGKPRGKQGNKFRSPSSASTPGRKFL